MLQNWLRIFEEGIPSLPRSNDKFLQKIWLEGRIKFDNKTIDPTSLDEYNTKLICAALHSRKSLMIILPDSLEQRSALLFSFGLIMHGLDKITKKQDGGTVLYFGSTIGIREQLSKVKLSRHTLDTVFIQTDLARRSLNVIKEKKPKFDGEESGTFLPKVFCAYAPADPTEVIEKYKPDWIAVDCSEEADISWISSLISNTQTLPIVAWSQNPFSNCITEFKRAGINVFQWNKAFANINNIKSVFKQNETYVNIKKTNISPIIIEGEYIDKLSNIMRSVSFSLKEADKYSDGRLSNDALGLGWNLFNSVLMLTVPYELYEYEVKKYWGMRGIGAIRDSLVKYLEAIEKISPVFSSHLSVALTYLDEAIDYIRGNAPPLWLALSDLCIDNSKDRNLFIVFPNEARKDIFLFALLARYNISEQDLSDINVHLTSIKNFHRSKELGQVTDKLQNRVDAFPSKDTEFIFVSIPSIRSSTRLYPFFEAYDLSFLIYPFQEKSLEKCVQTWNEILVPDIQGNFEVISNLGGEHILIDNTHSQFEPSLNIAVPKKLLLREARPKDVSKFKERVFWGASDPLAEATWLFTEETESEIASHLDEEDALAMNMNEVIGMRRSLIVENVISIIFDNGYNGLFDLDDTINVSYPHGSSWKIDERYLKSLRVGDTVIFIHGLKRQSLYDLIISRVHNHPSMELHVALVRQWQNEISNAYTRWATSGSASISILYDYMRQKGSQIESSQAMQRWLTCDTMCPSQPDDLYRLAEFFRLDFVLNHYQRISKAANRLRSIHRSLAVRLNNWLKKYAMGIESDDTALIDKELGLSLRDFKDSLMLLKVQSIEYKNGLYLRTSLGSIKKREDSYE